MGKSRYADTAERKLRIWPWMARLHALPVPQQDICDAPLVCLQINAEWASHISGSLEILRWKDAWIGTDEQIAQAIQSVEELMDKMSCECDVTPQLTSYYQELTTFQQTLANAYQGDLLNIDMDVPNVNFNSGSGDTPSDGAHRDNALCRACLLYVQTMAAESIRALEGATDFVSNIAGILPFINPLGAVIGLVIVVSAEIVNAAGSAPFKDQTAIENVACCMYEALKGAENTLENFQHCCDDCYVDCCSNEYWNAENMRGAFEDEFRNWLTFNRLLAEAFRYSKAGLLPGCQCDPCDFTVTFDEGGYSYSMTKGSVDAVGESGTQGAKQQQTDADTQEVQIDIPLVCDVQDVSFRYHYSTNRGDNNLTRRVQLLDSGGAVLAAVSGDVNMGTKNVWADHNVSLNYSGAVTLRVYLGFSQAPNAIGHLYIDNIHFSG